MLLDELIHAAGVGVHDPARFWIKESGVAFRGASEAVCAELLINEKRPGAENFRELPASDAAEQIHLPKAVLRHDVALRFREIFYRRGTDVRHSPAITFDADLLVETGQGSAPVDLWQRTVDKPPS